MKWHIPGVYDYDNDDDDDSGGGGLCILYKYSTMQLDTFHFVNIVCMYRRIDLSVQTTLSALSLWKIVMIPIPHTRFTHKHTPAFVMAFSQSAIMNCDCICILHSKEKKGALPSPTNFCTTKQKYTLFFHSIFRFISSMGVVTVIPKTNASLRYLSNWQTKIWNVAIKSVLFGPDCVNIKRTKATHFCYV